MSSTLDACFQNDGPESSTKPSTKLTDEVSSETEASTSQHPQPDKLRFVDEESDEVSLSLKATEGV